jgi:uncharacterized protein (TIGR03435 family)
MWQNLLKDRFGIVVHRELKSLSGDELVVAKGDPKLKLTKVEADAVPDDVAAGPASIDKNGFPELLGPGIRARISPGPGGFSAHLVGKAQTMAQLATVLGSEYPVVDKTGLTGKYDFAVAFTPDGPFSLSQSAVGQSSAPVAASEPRLSPDQTLGMAIEQLGLRLVRNKVTVEVLVIDHIAKTPTEN